VKTAEEARLHAESQRKRAEAERDMYKLIVRGWRDGLASTRDQEGDNGTSSAVGAEEAAASTLIHVTQGNGAMVGLGHLLRRLGRDSAVFADLSDASSGEDGDSMEEESGEDMLIENNNAVIDEASTHHNQRRDSATELSSAMMSANSLDAAEAITKRPQARAVSIPEADL
jgi:hypothetical protein